MSTHRCLPCKDTGLVWVGHVPSDWDVRRLGFYFSERRQKVSDTEFQPLSVTKLGIVPRLETAAKSDDGDNRKMVRQGDFVINGRSDRKGSSGLSALQGSVSLINIVLRQISPANMDFMHYLLRSIPFQEEFYRFGRGIVDDLWSTPFSEMRNIKLAVPPIPEQQAIAAFLDRETAKIDALVAEQERLLALLAEKRQAVISRAVIQGLDPSVPMKDSGVQWASMIPSHWLAVPLRYLARIGNGSTPNRDNLNYWESGTYPWVNSSQVNSPDVHEGAYFVTEAAMAQCHLPKVPVNSVLVALTGQGKTRGKASILRIEATINQHVAYLSVDESRLRPEFLRWTFETAYDFVRMESDGGGSTKGAITCEQLRNIQVLLPETEEQDRITQSVNKEVKRIGLLSVEAEQATNLLKERRSALISAAVTGKIDVRGLVPAVEPARAAA